MVRKFKYWYRNLKMKEKTIDFKLQFLIMKEKLRGRLYCCHLVWRVPFEIEQLTHVHISSSKNVINIFNTIFCTQFKGNNNFQTISHLVWTVANNIFVWKKD